MIKQLEQIKLIATELGVIFEDDVVLYLCTIKIPSAYYVPKGNYIVDPSIVYFFRYDEERITECLCFNNLIFDFENDGKLIWVGPENYDVEKFDDKTVKETLTKCLKELKEKEEELKIKNLGKDFE